MVKKSSLKFYVYVLTVAFLERSWSTLAKKQSSILKTIIRKTGPSKDVVNICYIDSETPQLERNQNEIKGLKCDNNGYCGRHENYTGFMCTCEQDDSTYVLSETKCLNNSRLRQGCDLRFGSWQYSKGWTWSNLDDPLLSLYLDDGYGITTAFDISNENIASCSLSNVTVLTTQGNWEEFEYNSRDVAFFVYRRYYHISWNTKSLREERKHKIRGHILRLSILCEQRSSDIGQDISRPPLRACLIVKVTGRLDQVLSRIIIMNKSNNGNGATLTIVLVVLFSILALVALLTVIIFYRRRRSSTTTSRFGFHYFAKKT